MQIFSCFKIMCFCVGFSCHVCHLINYNKTIHSLMYMRNSLEELRAKLATAKIKKPLPLFQWDYCISTAGVLTLRTPARKQKSRLIWKRKAYIILLPTACSVLVSDNLTNTTFIIQVSWIIFHRVAVPMTKWSLVFFVSVRADNYGFSTGEAGKTCETCTGKICRT